MQRPDGGNRGVSRDPGTFEDVERLFQVYGTRARVSPVRECLGHDRANLVGMAHADAALGQSVEMGDLILHLVQRAEVGTFRADGDSR